MGSGARASAAKERLCDRCFAAIAPGDPYCPDCGAPTGETAPAAESVVHGELAQANLLRLRGGLDESEKTLLAILRRFPNDPHAHELLGDVCVDRGEYERAAEWYDLALDLAPNSPDVRRKADEARQRLEARATADTAEVLGLPPETPRAAWWPLAAASGVLLLAIAIAVWPRSAPPAPLRVTVAAPPPVASAPTPNPTAVETPTTPVAVAPTMVSASAGTEEDRATLTALQAGTDGKRAQSVLFDPRTSTLTVTFDLVGTEDAARTALLVGREALNVTPAANAVTLRALSGGKLAYVADLARSGTDLTNVWPAAASPPITGSTP